MNREDYDTSPAEQSFRERQEDARRQAELDRQQESAEWSERQYRRYVAAKRAAEVTP